MTAIPATWDAITLPWLNEVLADPFGPMKDFTIKPLGEDLGYLSFLFRIEPDWEAASGQPSSMIVKFPSTEEGSRFSGNSLRAYERESMFYSECGARSACNPPVPYFSFSHPADDEHILIMEDLADCRFVNQVDGVSAADARLCFDAMAHHHAEFWGAENLDWLPPFSDYGTIYMPLFEAGAPQINENFHDMLSPVFSDNVDDALRLYPKVAERLQQCPVTLAHCDPRIENIAFAGDKPRFYDWQLASRGPGVYDLMYFFKQSMDADIRRGCQDELFDRYLRILADKGIDYRRDQLLADMSLACCTIWGFMAMIGNFFYRTETNEKLWRITEPRFMAMIEDFGAVDTLKSLS